MAITIICAAILILAILLSVGRPARVEQSRPTSIEVKRDDFMERYRQGQEKLDAIHRRNHARMERAAAQLERLQQLDYGPSRPMLTAGDDVIDARLEDVPPQLGSGR